MAGLEIVHGAALGVKRDRLSVRRIGRIRVPPGLLHKRNLLTGPQVEFVQIDVKDVDTILSWHERFGELKKTVVVKAGGVATVDFQYEAEGQR